MALRKCYVVKSWSDKDRKNLFELEEFYDEAEAKQWLCESFMKPEVESCDLTFYIKED